MAIIPEAIKIAWNDRQGPITFATVDSQGVPNIIYATCVNLYGDDTVVVADNYFQKTRQNVQDGCQGAVLFMTKDGKPYQIKGRIAYHTSGAIFEAMKQWNPKEHPGHAAAALTVDAIYSGAEKLA
ncbi:MAG: pyridoxamine 5'-phosphate oxidase family protein [Smithellaceae bacterium]